MKKQKSPKAYILGSKLNGIETVILEGHGQLRVMGFETIDIAKDNFKHAYDVLLAPSFTPSNPPSAEEQYYHMEFMRLIAFHPVILEVDQDSCLQLLDKWADKSKDVFDTEEKFFDSECWHLPMKTGFFKEFCVLEIAKDIETTPFVGQNGKMVIRINNIHHGARDCRSVKRPTDAEIDEILRQRGLL